MALVRLTSPRRTLFYQNGTTATAGLWNRRHPLVHFLSAAFLEIQFKSVFRWKRSPRLAGCPFVIHKVILKTARMLRWFVPPQVRLCLLCVSMGSLRDRLFQQFPETLCCGWASFNVFPQAELAGLRFRYLQQTVFSRTRVKTSDNSGTGNNTLYSQSKPNNQILTYLFAFRERKQIEHLNNLLK